MIYVTFTLIKRWRHTKCLLSQVCHKNHFSVSSITNVACMHHSDITITIWLHTNLCIDNNLLHVFALSDASKKISSDVYKELCLSVSLSFPGPILL